MAFYYVSILSIVPLGIAYVILALIFAGIVVVTRGIRGRGFVLSFIAIGFLFLPVSEEIWIAWHFAQACKQAGTFIKKKVQVAGYYDGTGTVTRIVGGPAYEFIESPERDGTYRRVERANEQERERALGWYAENHPGARPAPDAWITQPVSDRVQVVVEINTNYAWKVTKLDHPTARYQFRNTDPMNGTPWGHKIIRSGSVVIDTQTNEEIARYTSFGRGAPWYFVGLNVPSFACDAPGRWPSTKGTALIYREALIPIAK
jgi:hypothetical protein